MSICVYVQAYVRYKPDADNLTISLVLGGRLRNLNRCVLGCWLGGRGCWFLAAASRMCAPGSLTACAILKAA